MSTNAMFFVRRFTAEGSLVTSLNHVRRDERDAQQQRGDDDGYRRVVLHQFLLDMDLRRQPVEKLVAQEQKHDAYETVDGRDERARAKEDDRVNRRIIERGAETSCYAFRARARKLPGRKKCHCGPF